MQPDILLMIQKSGNHQLRLVVYHIFFEVLAPSLRWFSPDFWSINVDCQGRAGAAGLILEPMRSWVGFCSGVFRCEVFFCKTNYFGYLARRNLLAERIRSHIVVSYFDMRRMCESVKQTIEFEMWVFPKIVGFPPKSSSLTRFSIINYKPSILGYPYFWKHQYFWQKRAER